MGRIEGCGRGAGPNTRTTSAWSASRTPSAAISLASGVAARSGRTTKKSKMTPTIAAKTSVSTTAGAVERVANRPSRMAQKKKPASIAIAPTARLITPAPR